MGMTQQSALEAAGTFGNLFSAMGVGQDQTLEMSEGLIQLASDLASFNNLDPTDVLEKLRSGMVGEVEPMRALGVNLAETTVQQKALQMGLAKTTDELTFQDKVMARYAIIMDQTKNSQGDFARTADGLANSTRIAKAQLADTGAIIGKNLLPMALAATKEVSKLVSSFAGLPPETQKTIVGIAGIAAAAGPTLVILGTLTKTVSAIIPAIQGVITIMGAPLLATLGLVVVIIGGLIVAWNRMIDALGSPRLAAAQQLMQDGSAKSGRAALQMADDIQVAKDAIKVNADAAIAALGPLDQYRDGHDLVTSAANTTTGAIAGTTGAIGVEKSAIVGGALQAIGDLNISLADQLWLREKLALATGAVTEKQLEENNVLYLANTALESGQITREQYYDWVIKLGEGLLSAAEFAQLVYGNMLKIPSTKDIHINIWTTEYYKSGGERGAGGGAGGQTVRPPKPNARPGGTYVWNGKNWQWKPYGGSYANGGDVPGGATIMVGEEGPEIVTTRDPATVIPAGGMGKGGRAPGSAPTQIYQYYINGNFKAESEVTISDTIRLFELMRG
jgi:hypothetical protein